LESSIKEEIIALKEKSKESLRAAEVLLNEGLFARSISDSYYAMFYMVEALVRSIGQGAKSHAGLSTLFSKLFIKTGLIDKQFKDMYIDAMEERRIADYESLSSLSKERALDRLKEAKEFVDMALDYLKK
jgi:uncharacterized protein (UPF0332 family)